jgi:hypothetical protein
VLQTCTKIEELCWPESMILEGVKVPNWRGPRAVCARLLPLFGILLSTRPSAFVWSWRGRLATDPSFTLHYRDPASQVHYCVEPEIATVHRRSPPAPHRWEGLTFAVRLRLLVMLQTTRRPHCTRPAFTKDLSIVSISYGRRRPPTLIGLALLDYYPLSKVGHQ